MRASRGLVFCEAIAREQKKINVAIEKESLEKIYHHQRHPKGSQHQRDIQDIEVKVCLRRNCQNRQNRASGRSQIKG